MKVYWLIVDYHRWILDVHNTRGVYLVKAKNEKSAKQYLQKVIGFGSIESQGAITKDNLNKKHQRDFEKFFKKTGNICYRYDRSLGFCLPHHATDNHENWDNFKEEKQEEKSWYLSRRMRNYSGE